MVTPKRKFLALVAALVFLMVGGVAFGDVSVLLYHRVGDSRYPSTNVSLEGFRQQMIWLRDKGYTVVTTRALEDYLLGGTTLPDRSVVIQFDDGLRTVYTEAFPVLKEFKYPFSVFVTTEPVMQGYPDYVTWSMLDEMKKGGGEIGVHGHSHQRMAGPRKGETPEAFLKRIQSELTLSKSILEERGFPSEWFAYTFGEYGPELVGATKAAGYKLAFIQDPGAVDAKSDPYLLNRFAVVGSVAEMGLFKERLTYKALHLSENIPHYGLVTPSNRMVYSARVENPESYIPSSAGLYVSELGGLKASFNPDTGVISATSDKKLGNKLNRVIVTLKEKKSGAYALGSWSIIMGNK